MTGPQVQAGRGGFTILRGGPSAGSVAWSRGIGEDASFDTNMIAK